MSPTGYAKQRNSASRQRCRSTALARPLGRLAPAGHARKVPRGPVYQGRRPTALILHYPGHCPPRRSRPRDHSEGPPGRRQPPPVLIDRHRRPRRIMMPRENGERPPPVYYPLIGLCPLEWAFINISEAMHGALLNRQRILCPQNCLPQVEELVESFPTRGPGLSSSNGWVDSHARHSMPSACEKV